MQQLLLQSQLDSILMHTYMMSNMHDIHAYNCLMGWIQQIQTKSTISSAGDCPESIQW